jgi:hypothetical protein
VAANFPFDHLGYPHNQIARWHNGFVAHIQIA